MGLGRGDRVRVRVGGRGRDRLRVRSLEQAPGVGQRGWLSPRAEHEARVSYGADGRGEHLGEGKG